MNRIVYSTDPNDYCSTCGKPSQQCRCATAGASPQDGIVRVSRETKGRKGKGVTVIRGIPLSDQERRALCKKLKQKCGSGGSVKDGAIEIQGDKRDIVIPLLMEYGWQVKRSGG